MIGLTSENQCIPIKKCFGGKMNSIERVIIAGAAGRDFHDFNMLFRSDKRFKVLAFTATQIPNIDGRRYPPELAGELYPEGIPIHPEEDLSDLIKNLDVNLYKQTSI